MNTSDKEKNLENKINNSEMTTDGEFYKSLSKHLPDELEALNENENKSNNKYLELDTAPKNLSFDDLMSKIGGSGVFGCLHFTIIVLGMISGAWVLYSTSYFNLEPHYLCWKDGNENDKFTCFAEKVPDFEVGEKFCGTNLKHEYDFTKTGTIHGWVE